MRPSLGAEGTFSWFWFQCCCDLNMYFVTLPSSSFFFLIFSFSSNHFFHSDVHVADVSLLDRTRGGGNIKIELLVSKADLEEAIAVVEYECDEGVKGRALMMHSPSPVTLRSTPQSILCSSLHCNPSYTVPHFIRTPQRTQLHNFSKYTRSLQYQMSDPPPPPPQQLLICSTFALFKV